LTEWYAGRVHYSGEQGWGLSVDGGVFLPWVSGREVAEEDSFDSPNLKDIFRTIYRTGPIEPIDTTDAGAIDDPGRVRVEQLFRATYGDSSREVHRRLGKVRFFGVRYAFHERAVPALERVVQRLESAATTNPQLLAYLKNIGGTWAWRRISRSRNLSPHSFGIAIDLNAKKSHYWRWLKRGSALVWKNTVPQEIVDAFEAEGFIWGGRWQHFDTMHFEYRPELTSPRCRDESP
jgi:hypothetical protein